MAFTTLTFGDFDPVTGAPHVDGYTIADAGVFTNEDESGYVQGGRLTYGGGSGFPPVIVDAVRNGNALNFGFFCRFDLGFDDADTIVVAVKPTPTAAADTARRIDIHPVYLDVGADNQTVTGQPAGDPDDTPAGTPPGAIYHIRHDKPPARLEHWRATGGTSPRWTTENPTGPATPYAPPGVEIKARSWMPPVPTLTTSVGAQTLPSTTFDVLSTAGFPPAGQFRVGANTITYGAKTATQFTGCSGGTGSVPAGSAVSIPEMAWSAELKLPLRLDDGGGGHIDLSPAGFGLFIAVIRAGITPASGTGGPGGLFAAQYLFPTNAAALSGTLGENVNIATYGSGLVPGAQSPPGANTGIGVRIRNGELGIGARLASAGAWSQLGNEIDRSNNNRLVAQVENTDPATPANAVTAEVRIANWGMPPAQFDAWQRAPGATPNPSSPASVVSGTPVELTVDWAQANIPSEYADHPHQCIWVQLSSTSAVNFTNSSDRRNMDFVPLSAEERPAEISGVGHPPPNGGSEHDFLLVTNTRLVQVPDYAEQPSMTTHAPRPKMKSVFLWIVHGYRLTGDVLKIRGRSYEIVDPSPGQFGVIAEHDAPEDALTSQLVGGGIKGQGNVQRLRVPQDGSVTIRTRIEAGPAKAAPETRPGCLGAIVKFIRELLRR